MGTGINCTNSVNTNLQVCLVACFTTAYVCILTTYHENAH